MMLWALPGQAVHTTIKVVDAQDHTPLAFARIRIHESGQIYQSNPQGIVRLSVDKWPQTATISYIGYHDLHLTLTKERTLYEAALQPLSYTLGPVQVVGDRVKGSKTGNIAQVDAFRIAAGQGQTLAGMLDDLPGMRVLSTGAMIEKPIIEGMNGSRIAIIDNSAKLMGQHWGDDHAPEMSISSYAKVHVEKGAESVRYGANAIGGIIVVDTKVDPRLSGTKGSVNTAYTQNGRMFGFDAFVESTLPGVEHFRYRVGGKFYKSGDYRTAAYNVSNTGSRLLDLKAAWAWQWNDKWQWNQHLGLYDTEIGVFSGSHLGTTENLLQRFKQGRPSPEEIGPFSYAISAPRQRIIHTISNTQVGYDFDADNHFDVRLVYQQDYRREYEIRKADLSNLPTFAFKLSTLNLHADWQHRLSAIQGMMETGADFNFIRNVSDAGTKAIPIIPNYVSRTAALYSLLHGRINNKLRMEAGMRTDYQYLSAAGYNNLGQFYGGTQHYFSISGTLGGAYILSPHSTLRTNLGLAWRAPEMNELYSKGVHHGDAVYQIGDADLHTEKAIKWTAGYHLKTQTVDVHANAFVHYIHDYIYDIPRYTVDGSGQRIPEIFELISGAYPIYYYVQSNGLFAGGDLAVELTLGKHLTYEVSGEWMRARNLSLHTYFPNIPSDRYRQKVTFHTSLGPWQIKADANHQYVTKQTRFDPDIDLLPDTPPAYHLLGGNLSVTRTWGNITWCTYTQISNALNTLYKDYTNRLRYYTHDRGRSITLGIRMSF